VAGLVPFDPRTYAPPPRDPTVARVPFGDYADLSPESAGVREYLAIVRRQFWLVLSILAIAVGVTLYMILTAPALYRAVAVVRLADARRALTGGMDADAGTGSLGRETDQLQSMIQVLMSRAIAGEAVDRDGLRLVPTREQHFVEGMTNIKVDPSAPFDTIRFSFDGDGVTARGRQAAVHAGYGQPLDIQGVHLTVARRPAVTSSIFQVISREEAIGDVLGSFFAAPRPKTDIIDLAYVGLDALQAQRVTNSMAMAFQAYNAQNAQQQSKRRRLFLEAQLQQTDSMLSQAQASYSSFRSRKQVFSTKEKATAQQTNIIDIDMKRAELDADRRMYEGLLAEAQRTDQPASGGLQALVSSSGIAGNPVVMQLYTQLTGYETARDNLVTAGAARTNPDVIALDGSIQATRTKLLAAVRSQLTGIDAKIAAMDKLRAVSAVQIATMPAAETEEAQLEQQVANIQKIADQLQDEHQKAKIAEAVEAGQVEIVDLASVPWGPVPTSKTRKFALGILLGLMMGVGAAVFVDGLNTSIRRRDDVERVLQIPGLAVIPKFAAAATNSRLLGQRRLAGNGKDHPASALRDHSLVTIVDAGSSGAEAYRTLRTNLIFSQAVQTLRTMVITSASPGEGKTTTAANLAVSFAQQGMRILLVDCDLRRSRIHKLFEIARGPGITELVIGQETQDDVVRETSITGLYVVPSGQLPPNPSELLGGDRMRRVLASLAEGYDMVIMDSPPLLAASDGAILATMVDGVVMVVRAGVTEEEAAQQAMQQLGSVGARVVGAVLNDPDSKVPQYGSYYRYEYATADKEG
jgi:succinoglycan biosynthesis transport protein ExoP